MSVRLVCLLSLSLAGCSSLNMLYNDSREMVQGSGLIRSESITRNSRWVLPRNSSFYLARSSTLADVSIDETRTLTTVVEEAALRHFRRVRIGLFPESLDYSLTSASMAGANYVIYPTLLTWDDNLGTWTEIAQSLLNDSTDEIVTSFGLDQVAVQIIILDTATGNMVDLVKVESESGFFSLYGDQPGALLAPALENYFSNLALKTG
jgi:hypothetical protein